MVRKFISGLKNIGKIESINILIKLQRSKNGLNKKFIYPLTREAIINTYTSYNQPDPFEPGYEEDKEN